MAPRARRAEPTFVVIIFANQRQWVRWGGRKEHAAVAGGVLCEANL